MPRPIPLRCSLPPFHPCDLAFLWFFSCYLPKPPQWFKSRPTKVGMMLKSKWRAMQKPPPRLAPNCPTAYTPEWIARSPLAAIALGEHLLAELASLADQVVALRQARMAGLTWLSELQRVGFPPYG